MATKNYAKMTTKKLNALLATVDDSEKAAIEAVLAQCEQVQSDSSDGELTEEEKAAIAYAEEHDGLNPMYEGRKTKAKMSDEERSAIAESLKPNIHHRCQVVPFGTIEWVDGYIAGVVEDKRNNKVLFAIKTDDGRRIVKVHDSKLIKIFDEVIEIQKTVRTRKTKERVEKGEWTPEEIAAEISHFIGNVGKAVEIEQYKATDAEGNERVLTIGGRIVAIVPDKRSQRLFYKIEAASKYIHKVVSAQGLRIVEEFDEEGKAINEKYINRRETATTRTTVSPQDRVIRCEENLKKAEEKLQKATEELEAKKQQLEKAKAELNAYLAQQTGETEELA